MLARYEMGRECLCWLGSLHPNGDITPKCGCQGFRKGRHSLLRTAGTVQGWILADVRELVERHSLVTTPRGLLSSDSELGALGAALCERWLPVRPGLEDLARKACKVCVDKRRDAVKAQSADFICAELNACLGDGVVSISSAAAGASAAAVGSAAGSLGLSTPGLSKASLKRALSPRRQNGAASASAAAAAPATPPREGQENQAPDAEQTEFALKKQRKDLQRSLSKVMISREQWKGKEAAATEQCDDLQETVERLTAKSDELHEYKRRAQRAEARIRELERQLAQREAETGTVQQMPPAVREQIEMQVRLDLGDRLDRAGADDVHYRTSLSGVKLNLRRCGYNSRHWASQPTRMVCAHAHVFGGTALDQTLPNLLTTLTAYGTDVKCTLTDSTEVTIGGITESYGQIRWQLALDCARLHAPTFDVPDEAPTPLHGAAMEAHPAADGGQLEPEGWWKDAVFDKVSEWDEKHEQAEDLLVTMPEMGPPLSAKEFLARHHAGNWAVVKFTGCAGLALMIDDTSKFNGRNMSAVLIGGAGLTNVGKVRLLYLQELFGKMGNTGDLRMLLRELERFRNWQRSIAVPESALLYLYDFISFCVDNCNGMTGPRAGLVKKISQVRAVLVSRLNFLLL